MTARTAAAKAGLRYYKAKPCPHDQDTRRYVASGSCVSCNSRKAQEYRASIKALVAKAKAG